jgi:hypothetical protein
LSDWCNFGGIPLAAWALGRGKTVMWAFPYTTIELKNDMIDK